MTSSAVGSNARFSVVIPCYNCAGTIAATIESIRAQSHPAAEIIAVDDGSKDDTLAILRSLGSDVTIIAKPNGGVSSARNAGASAAGNPWIAFCDSDDLWHPRKLEVMSACIASLPEIEFYFHDFSIERSGDVIAKRSTESRTHSLFPVFKRSKRRMRDLLSAQTSVPLKFELFGQHEVQCNYGPAMEALMLGNFVQPSTTVINARLYKELNGFDESFRHAEDTEFFLRAAKRHPFAYVDAPLLTYRILVTSLLNTSIVPTTENGTWALIKHCVEDQEVFRRAPDLIHRRVADKLSRLAWLYLTELRTVDARRAAAKALRYRKVHPRALALWLSSWIPKDVWRVARSLKSGILRRA